MWHEVALAGLDAIDICRLGQTCRNMYRVTQNSHLWRIMWVRKYGSTLPDQSGTIVELDLEDLEDESLATKHQWRHHYLSSDAFYRRWQEDHGTGQFTWVGTNDQTIVSGEPCSISGQVSNTSSGCD